MVTPKINDGRNIDSCTASYYIDERLQEVFGHCRLYFQNVPLEDCHGVRFGKYGSFLSDCQHSPCNSPFQDISQPPQSRKGSVASAADQYNHVMPNKRIKLSAETITTSKNKSLYRSLGLDTSSSEGDSPICERDFIGSERVQTASPTCLIEIMSTPPILEDVTLSPLPDNLISLVEMQGKEDKISSPVELQEWTDEANNRISEADDLKHCANTLKSSGLQIGSTEIFFQAALKYLDAASHLETRISGSEFFLELTPFKIYDKTAKLLEYCAREYESWKDMACAALAYKCLEASNMQIVYSTDDNARRDCQELQVSLQSLTSGSNYNIKNQNYMEKNDVPADSTSSELAENYLLDSRSQSMFVELLNFTGYANSGMEASRKSQITFGYASKVLEETGSSEIVDCIERALNCGFHDMKKLLYLVYEAIEALGS